MRQSNKYWLKSAIAVALLPMVSLADTDEHLPPLKPWHGKSESLINDAKAKQTPAERTGLSATPNYNETVAYLHKLAAQSPYLRLKSIGYSAQDRPIFMIVASPDGKKDSAGIKANGKPTILVQAGIHSGEIDGKDAGLMLLRDIAQGKEISLIQQVNLLFIPILSGDGHERSSAYNRVNQRGPEIMGWRTNSRNLNLNRDYAKAETAEIKAVLKVINDYNPDLYLDIHVTDGEDYQYDITYGYNQPFAAQSPNIAGWMNTKLKPFVDGRLTQWGHTPGPLIFAWDKNDFAKGIAGWTASPRFSNGYGDVRHLPTILVENHSLKPYNQRVLGTYVLIKACLEILGQEKTSLRQAIAQDSEQRPTTQVVDWSYDTKQPEYIPFAGITYRRYEDKITGQTEVEWLGEAINYQKLPVFWARTPKVTVKVPKAYVVPVQYQAVIDSLERHGITMETVKMQNDGGVKSRNYEQLAVDEYQFDKMPFEGRMRVSATFQPSIVDAKLPAGSKIVRTDQPLGKLAVALLEPSAPDSYFAWGYFNSIFQRTEYIENYAIIPLANKMMTEDPQLKKRFEAKVKTDKDFAADPRARLDFFYKKTAYHDKTYLKYPVLIIR